MGTRILAADRIAESVHIIEAIRHLLEPPEKPPREIGFHVREMSPRYGARKRR